MVVLGIDLLSPACLRVLSKLAHHHILIQLVGDQLIPLDELLAAELALSLLLGTNACQFLNALHRGLVDVGLSDCVNLLDGAVEAFPNDEVLSRD
jgi:hypothetical protein